MGNLRRVKKRFINMSVKTKKRFLKSNPLSDIEIHTTITKKKKYVEDTTNQKLLVQ